MRTYLLVLIITIVGVGNAFSQGSDLAIHMFGIGSFPTADYGKDIADDTKLTRRYGFNIGENIGLADFGYGVGAELVTPVGIRGLQWIFSAKAIINGTNTESIQSDFRSELGDSVDLTLDYGQWLNFPVMTGFRFDHLFTHTYTVYGILQAGLNFSKMPSRKAMVGDLTVEDASFEFARDYGFECGIGLLLNQRYNFGLRYMSLRTTRYEGTKKMSEVIFPEIFSREMAILGEKRTISMLYITFGIQLFK